MKEYIDKNKCAECGGKCCNAIYLSRLDGGTMPEDVYFEEWLDQWEKEFINSGAADSDIKPIFNPHIVHLASNRAMRDSLARNGINPFACKYLGKNGCVLPRHHRPQVCNTYNCEDAKWDARKLELPQKENT